MFKFNFDNSHFYLNTDDPANASGVASSLGYCYYAVEGIITVRVFQATVGFYRQGVNSSFDLVSDFYVLSINVSTVLSDEVHCEQMKIPPLEIQEGDMIGVCSRNFFQDSVGRLRLVSIGRSRLLRNHENIELCGRVGVLPQNIQANELERRRRLLHLYSNITSAWKCCYIKLNQFSN